MGVMEKEIKKLNGRDSFLHAQQSLDDFIKAKNYKEREDVNTAFLKELYYGMDKLLATVIEQDEKIDRLLNNIQRGTIRKSSKVKVRRARPLISESERANLLIESHKDTNGRVTWKTANDPQALVFAYLHKAESEGIDIKKSTHMQEIPEYRRVFQFVVYNIGSWKNIIEQYYKHRFDTVMC